MPAVMEVVDRFPYLGDMVARDGSDTHAVNGRIEAGSKAFGALRGCIFSSTSINRQAKLAVYEAIVLSTSSASPFTAVNAGASPRPFARGCV